MPTVSLGRLSKLLLVFTCIVPTVSCSKVEPVAVPSEYVRPGWMAEAAQHEEELSLAQEACLQGKGYPSTRKEEPPYGFSLPDGVDFDAFRTALAECTREAVGEDAARPLSRGQLETLYLRNLDVQECLRAEGHATEAAPTKETFVDSGGQWSAYAGLAAEGIDEQELGRLYAACPQATVR